jgi:hypothetical protein
MLAWSSQILPHKWGTLWKRYCFTWVVCKLASANISSCKARVSPIFLKKAHRLFLFKKAPVILHILRSHVLLWFSLRFRLWKESCNRKTAKIYLESSKTGCVHKKHSAFACHERSLKWGSLIKTILWFSTSWRNSILEYSSLWKIYFLNNFFGFFRND